MADPKEVASVPLDDETERLIRGVLTTYKGGHPAVSALRYRIRELVEEARANGVWQARNGVTSFSVCPVSGEFSIPAVRSLNIADGYAECERCHARLISPTTGMLATDRCHYCHGRLYAFPKPETAVSTPANPLHTGGLGRTYVPYVGETTIPGRSFPDV
jgi:hypothetical protein